MPTNTPRRAGRHFLQIPGPTNVPDRILRAIDRPSVDHRGPDFGRLTLSIMERLKQVFRCSGPVVIYTASGTGAWSAALANTLSPGDHVLMVETGQFAVQWRTLAQKLGLAPELIETDWRRGAPPEAIAERLAADQNHTIKAVCVVHNETSTGAVSRIADIRRLIDAARHPALLMVDTISGLGCLPYDHDGWGVDVSISGSQKGLMMPPGLSFTAMSDKALAAHKTAKLARTYWDWSDMLPINAKGYFPFTPATNMLFGLDTALDMLLEEGLDNVIARHRRHGQATRAAAAAWGLDNLCVNVDERSDSVTTLLVPAGHDADKLRAIVLDRYDMALGMGLGRMAGKVFRIAHMGDLNDLTLLGALSGVEMGLGLAGIPHSSGGVQAAMHVLGR